MLAFVTWQHTHKLACIPFGAEGSLLLCPSREPPLYISLMRHSVKRVFSEPPFLCKKERKSQSYQNKKQILMDLNEMNCEFLLEAYLLSVSLS